MWLGSAKTPQTPTAWESLHSKSAQLPINLHVHLQNLYHHIHLCPFLVMMVSICLTTGRWPSITAQIGFNNLIHVSTPPETVRGLPLANTCRCSNDTIITVFSSVTTGSLLWPSLASLSKLILLRVQWESLSVRMNMITAVVN